MAARTSLLAGLALAVAAPLGAQEASYPFSFALAEAPSQTPITFWFTGTSSKVLSDLWAESVVENEERVACLGGHEQPIKPGSVWGHLHGFLVTSVVPVTPAKTDSLHADAQRSVELCAPPGFVGTVHTHITPYNGYPYSTFSMSDREIIAQWFRKYGRANGTGLFCVLYTETMAYCEYDTLSGDVPYAGPLARR